MLYKNGGNTVKKESIAVFEKMSVPGALAKLIVPSVISQLATLILNLTDAFFVGRTGDTCQISAMTITFPIVMFMTCTAMIFGTGGNANMAAALAGRKEKKAAAVSAFSFYAAIIVISCLSVLFLPVETSCLQFLGADASSLSHCRGYLLWVFHIPCAAMVGSQVLSQLFVAEGETKTASIGITGGGIINIILDPVFVLGLGMGITGAGIATCIANFSTLLFFVWMWLRKRKVMAMSLKPGDYTPGLAVARSTFAVGIPAGLSIFLMNCSDFVRNYLLGFYGGQSELAAWGTVQKLSSAFMQICIGVVQGVRPLAAYNYAAGAIRRTRSIIRGAFLILAVYALFCFGIVMLIPGPFVSLFLPVKEVAPVAEKFFRIWIPCFFGVCMVEGMNGILQAFGRWKISLAGVVCNRMLLYIPCMLLLSGRFGIPGVLFSQTISETTVAVGLMLVYRRLMKREDGRRREVRGSGRVQKKS